MSSALQSNPWVWTKQSTAFFFCLSNVKRHKRRPRLPFLLLFFSETKYPLTLLHSSLVHSSFSSGSFFPLTSPRPQPYICTMAQDSSDVAPNPSAASTAIHIDSTLNIIPPQSKVELQGFDKIREKLKPLLLYVVSFAQFLDIGTIHALFFRPIRSFSTLAH